MVTRTATAVAEGEHDEGTRRGRDRGGLYGERPRRRLDGALSGRAPRGLSPAAAPRGRGFLPGARCRAAGLAVAGDAGGPTPRMASPAAAGRRGGRDPGRSRA